MDVKKHIIEFKFLILIALGLIYSIGLINAQTDSINSYTIKKGDVLEISVMEHPEFSVSGILVMPDGYVQFPGLGSIPAAGMTMKKFTEILQKDVEKYVVNPVLTVFVRMMPNQVINVVGYVNHPGQIQVFEPADLITVLSKAGGIKDIRKCKWVTIVRVNQTSEKYSVDKLFSKNSNRQKIPLLNVGDTVYVIEPGDSFNWSIATFITQLAYLALLFVNKF